MSIDDEIFTKTPMQKERDKFFNNLRDYQWELHLRKTAKIVKEQHQNKRKSDKNVNLLNLIGEITANVNGETTITDLNINRNGDISIDQVARQVLGGG